MKSRWVLSTGHVVGLEASGAFTSGDESNATGNGTGTLLVKSPCVVCLEIADCATG